MLLSGHLWLFRHSLSSITAQPLNPTQKGARLFAAHLSSLGTARVYEQPLAALAFGSAAA